MHKFWPVSTDTLAVVSPYSAFPAAADRARCGAVGLRGQRRGPGFDPPRLSPALVFKNQSRSTTANTPPENSTGARNGQSALLASHAPQALQKRPPRAESHKIDALLKRCSRSVMG